MYCDRHDIKHDGYCDRCKLEDNAKVVAEARARAHRTVAVTEQDLQRLPPDEAQVRETDAKSFAWGGPNERVENGGPAVPAYLKPLTEPQPELPGIESTMAERSSRYGAFQEHAQVTDDLVHVLEQSRNWSEMPAEMKQAARVIMDKFGRMCTGDFAYHDNWHDIVGYGKLGEKCAERIAADKQLEIDRTWAVRT